jgi:hypothetical protein
VKLTFTSSLVARYHDLCSYAKPSIFHLSSMLYQKLSTAQRVGLGVHTSGQSREQDDQVRSLRICFLASLHTPTGLPYRRPRIVIRTWLSLLARIFGRIGLCACLSWHRRPTQQYGSFVIQLAKQIVKRYYVYFEQDGVVSPRARRLSPVYTSSCTW